MARSDNLWNRLATTPLGMRISSVVTDPVNRGAMIAAVQNGLPAVVALDSQIAQVISGLAARDVRRAKQYTGYVVLRTLESQGLSRVRRRPIAGCVVFRNGMTYV